MVHGEFEVDALVLAGAACARAKKSETARDVHMEVSGDDQGGSVDGGEPWGRGKRISLV